MGNDSFDLIYLRLACGGVSSWSGMYSKIFQYEFPPIHSSVIFSLSKTKSSHLKPGIGYLEHVEVDLEPRCDDGPVPGKLSDWYRYLMDASDRTGKSLRYDRQSPRILEGLGYTDVKETILKLPLNDWATEEPARGLGRWNSVVFHAGVEALSLGPLTRVYEWPIGDVRRLIKEVQAFGLDRRIHCYQTV